MNMKVMWGQFCTLGMFSSVLEHRSFSEHSMWYFKRMLGLQNQSRWLQPPQSNPVLIRPQILGQAVAQGEADCVTMAALYKTITLCTPPIIDIGIIQRHRAARYNIYTGETLVPPLNPPVSVVIEADTANLSSVHTPCLPYTYFVSLHQCVHTTCLPCHT